MAFNGANNTIFFGRGESDFKLITPSITKCYFYLEGSKCFFREYEQLQSSDAVAHSVFRHVAWSFGNEQ